MPNEYARVALQKAINSWNSGRQDDSIVEDITCAIHSYSDSEGGSNTVNLLMSTHRIPGTEANQLVNSIAAFKPTAGLEIRDVIKGDDLVGEVKKILQTALKTKPSNSVRRR